MVIHVKPVDVAGRGDGGQLALSNINACKAAMRSKVNKSNNNYKEQGGQLLKKKVKQLVSIRLLDEWQPRRLSAETDSQTRGVRQADRRTGRRAGRQAVEETVGETVEETDSKAVGELLMFSTFNVRAD